MNQPLPASVFQTASLWLATGLGLGTILPAPGTFATAIWGIPLAALVGQLPNIGWQILAIVLLISIGIPASTSAGRTLGGIKDNQAIVWDEIASVPIVFLLVPLTNWRVAVAGFLLHRLMDITKPPPARQLEALPEGTGVMADDVIAALYACAALAGLAWIDGRTGWNLLSTFAR